MEQANSENCGPPRGNKFDLENSQRSRHGANWKGLLQGPGMPKYQCSNFNTSEDMSQVKVFVTDRGTDKGTDGQTDEWDLMSPAFSKVRGTIIMRKWL